MPSEESQKIIIQPTNNNRNNNNNPNTMVNDKQEMNNNKQHGITSDKESCQHGVSAKEWVTKTFGKSQEVDPKALVGGLLAEHIYQNTSQGNDNGDIKDVDRDKDERQVQSTASVTKTTDGKINKGGQQITLTELSNT
ncbi:hypothetical protein KY285_025465 [Solanum tuberosum]|nr:hypothetical protein KY289_023959 [Solanum tuberosum]KAH0677664.1 hypothetical protein KY285_025465 [Solanum tuberosum]